VAADGAFTATADGRAFSGGTRIYDFIFLTTAFRTTHKTTSNCGYTFVAHSILRCQGWVIHNMRQINGTRSEDRACLRIILGHYLRLAFGKNVRDNFIFYGNSKRPPARDGDQLQR
jgi:hypothetical protein